MAVTVIYRPRAQSGAQEAHRRKSITRGEFTLGRFVYPTNDHAARSRRAGRGRNPRPGLQSAARGEKNSRSVIETAVFTLAIKGKLRPTDAAAEIRLQDAAEAAHEVLRGVRQRADGLVSADDLAMKFGMSPRTMRRLIKKHRKDLEQLGPIVEGDE